MSHEKSKDKKRRLETCQYTNLPIQNNAKRYKKLPCKIDMPQDSSKLPTKSSFCENIAKISKQSPGRYPSNVKLPVRKKSEMRNRSPADNQMHHGATIVSVVESTNLACREERDNVRDGLNTDEDSAHEDDEDTSIFSYNSEIEMMSIHTSDDSLLIDEYTSVVDPKG